MVFNFWRFRLEMEKLDGGVGRRLGGKAAERQALRARLRLELTQHALRCGTVETAR